MRRNKPSKIDPIYQKLTVDKQLDNTISGKTDKQRNTTAHVSKIKRLRQIPSLQDTDSDTDTADEQGPSGV